MNGITRLPVRGTFHPTLSLTHCDCASDETDRAKRVKRELDVALPPSLVSHSKYPAETLLKKQTDHFPVYLPV